MTLPRKQFIQELARLIPHTPNVSLVSATEVGKPPYTLCKAVDTAKVNSDIKYSIDLNQIINPKLKLARPSPLEIPFEYTSAILEHAEHLAETLGISPGKATSIALINKGLELTCANKGIEVKSLPECVPDLNTPIVEIKGKRYAVTILSKKDTLFALPQSLGNLKENGFAGILVCRASITRKGRSISSTSLDKITWKNASALIEKTEFGLTVEGFLKPDQADLATIWALEKEMVLKPGDMLGPTLDISKHKRHVKVESVMVHTADLVLNSKN